MAKNKASYWRRHSPAFPLMTWDTARDNRTVPGEAFLGMSVREHFAIQILAGFVSIGTLTAYHDPSSPTVRQYVQRAVQLADALVAELCGESDPTPPLSSADESDPPFEPSATVSGQDTRSVADELERLRAGLRRIAARGGNWSYDELVANVAEVLQVTVEGLLQILHP